MILFIHTSFTSTGATLIVIVETLVEICFFNIFCATMQKKEEKAKNEANKKTVFFGLHPDAGLRFYFRHK